jgi:aspartate-semialdehyde dehydrogenase
LQKFAQFLANIWGNPIALFDLPSAPAEPIHVYEESRYPQSRLHANREKGMQLGIGRLRRDSVFDIYYLALARNTIRGAVLNAELLVEKGYL